MLGTAALCLLLLASAVSCRSALQGLALGILAGTAASCCYTVTTLALLVLPTTHSTALQPRVQPTQSPCGEPWCGELWCGEPRLRLVVAPGDVRRLELEQRMLLCILGHCRTQ